MKEKQRYRQQNKHALRPQAVPRRNMVAVYGYDPFVL